MKSPLMERPLLASWTMVSKTLLRYGYRRKYLRWRSWLWSKLVELVSLEGGVKRYLTYVFKQLPIKLSPQQRSQLAVL